MDPHTLLTPVHRLLADERRRQATDRDLLQAFRQCDNDAFTELLRRHGPMVMRLALHLLHHRQDAEDVFQATFLTLARKASSLRNESSVAAWLHRVAWRLAVRSRAAAKRLTAGVNRLVENHQPADEISLRESQELLHQELAALPEHLRLPLVLCYLQERTRDEAARRLGWSLGTLKRRLEQGRKLLHDRLSRHGVTLPAVLSASLLASAEVPASLAGSTLGLATSALAGSASLSASVAVLLAEASSSVKMKAVWGLVLILGAVAGAGAWVYQGQNSEPAEPPAKLSVSVPSPIADNSGKVKDPANDLFGDPLPAGAIARLGTVRLRHGDYISSLWFAPDCKMLVSMGLDGVRVWDAATGKPVRHFGVGAWLTSSALSSDGRRIAFSRRHAGLGGPVEVWDAATGKLIHKMGGRHYSLVRFSPDGKQLAALAGDEGPRQTGIPWTVDLWDAQTGRDIRTLTGPKEYIGEMAFSADGKTLLLGGSGKAISIRSTADGKEVRRIRDLPADARILALSPHGDRAAFIELWTKKWDSGQISWGPGTGVVLLDLQTGAVLRRWSMKAEIDNGFLRNSWSALAFSSDGRRLAACPGIGPVRIWDTATGAEKSLLSSEQSHSGGVAFSPDGKTLAVGEGGRSIRPIDAETGADRLPLRGHRSGIAAIALSRDGKTAFTADEERAIQRWDAVNGRERERHLDLKAKVVRLLLSPDGRTLFSQYDDKTLRAWDVASSAERWRRDDLGGHWGSMALSADGQMLAASGDAEILKLFKTSTGEQLHSLSTKAPIWNVAFAPDASAVFALLARWTVRRWETASGRPLPDLTLPADPAEPFHGSNDRGSGELAVLSPNGRLAAYAFEDKILRILDVFGQRQIHRFTHLPGYVATMAFSSDGRSFVWAERTGIIHWLELSSGGERRTLPGHAGEVQQMVFDAGCNHLISASADTTALVWELFGHGSATLSAEQRHSCWLDLADKDAAKAYRAMCRLIAAPAEALPLLHSHLKPVEGVDQKRIDRWIADLDAAEFAVRDKATKELQQLGDLAELKLRKALASRPTLEMRRRLQGLLDDIFSARPSLTIIRQLRAVEVLEHLGTPESLRLLETLTKGAEGARQTREAKAAVQRLLRKK